MATVLRAPSSKHRLEHLAKLCCFFLLLIKHNISKTWRPSSCCKLCDSTFQTDFRKGIPVIKLMPSPCKFYPCLHSLICYDCRGTHDIRYKDCPFCGEPIERATCNLAYGLNCYRIRNHTSPDLLVHHWENTVLYKN